MASTDRVAFILGAGAHNPFGFPLGEELKQIVAKYLDEGTGVTVDERMAVRRALLDCGVSIDRFLSTNPKLNDRLRPFIARGLLLREEHDTSNAGATDWIGYLWPSLIGDSTDAITQRFAFVTFNYDRSLEYRIARCWSGLRGIPLAEACSLVADLLRVFHVYGSLGSLAPNDRNYLAYGDKSGEVEAAKRIKIIGEHDTHTTRGVHEKIAHADFIFVLGCQYHPENMSLLSLDTLLNSEERTIIGSSYGLTEAEVAYTTSKYPYLKLRSPNWKAIELLRNCPEFQQLR